MVLLESEKALQDPQATVKVNGVYILGRGTSSIQVEINSDDKPTTNKQTNRHLFGWGYIYIKKQFKKKPRHF